MSRTWDYMPGVPAAGHLTGGGAWHPGRAHGCRKCAPPAPYRRGDQVQVLCADTDGTTTSATLEVLSCTEGAAHDTWVLTVPRPRGRRPFTGDPTLRYVVDVRGRDRNRYVQPAPRGHR